MRVIDLPEMKRVLFNILEFVDQFCSDNGIQYYLCGGTALGAVRHAGFIPWDDDIDIMMKRDDYDRFIDLFKHSNTGYFSLLHHSIQRDYTFPYAKVADSRTVLREEHKGVSSETGVYIDIFPIEAMSDSISIFHKAMHYRDRIMKVITYKSLPFDWKNRSFIKNIFLVLLKFVLSIKPNSFFLYSHLPF